MAMEKGAALADFDRSRGEFVDAMGACPDEALSYLKADFPLFWVPAPTDVYKAMIGGYHVSSDWKDTAFKRQRNYSLSLTPADGSARCTD